MQRVRTSLPYFKEFGWDAEVVMVDEKYADQNSDPLLLQSIPDDIKIHKVKALKKQWTSKLGLGSIALRSLWFYKQAVNKLLQKNKYDLIYFSTTQFPVCVLGAYWKNRFCIPYVIDMQDPWHTDYYQDKPRHQRPAKYWFSYRLNKYLEPVAVKNASGLISVSAAYIDELKSRYPEIKNIPSAVITFGAFKPDLAIAQANKNNFTPLLNPDFINVVYVGRGGADMHQAVSKLFAALQAALESDKGDLFKKLRFYFIGTSYAANGQGSATIMPLAEQYNLQQQVIELTDRISYYHTLLTLQQADALFIPGSDDPKYTASKIFPYLLTQKPVLAIFNAASSVIGIMRQYGVKYVYSYNTVTQSDVISFLEKVISGQIKIANYNTDAVKAYSAQELTAAQCRLFDKAIHAGS